MAKAILGRPAPPPDPVPLRKRIQSLKSSPQENDPEWWNNLAGAYIRLGEPRTAIDLLEPVKSRFPNDYGIHANLGTAYHLAGRYKEAEQEIARDLEINPEAHFGLEKYHLALLQYLIRDQQYRKEHVYVDEWTRPFMEYHLARKGYLGPTGKLDVTNTNGLDVVQISRLEKQWKGNTNGWEAKEIARLKSFAYEPPAYRFKWDLAADPHFKEGIINMAELNPNEPACFVMLGVASIKENNYNLAVAAFERAIRLQSPQTDHLREFNEKLDSYIWGSHEANWPIYGILSLIPTVILIYIFSKVRRWRKKRIAQKQYFFE